MSEPKHTPGPCCQEDKAIARLIAAAPELLDLVEDLLIAYELGYWEGDDDLKEKGDALLKRVRGEASPGAAQPEPEPSP